MESILVFVILLAVPMAIAYGVYRWIRGVFSRGHELRALSQQGVTVTGKVRKLERIIRSRAGTDQLYLTYQFEDSSGQAHVKRLKVFSKEYERLSQGDPIEVVYLRDRPEVNAARTVVDEMRVALARQEGARS